MISAKDLATWAMCKMPPNEARAGLTSIGRLTDAITARDAEHRAELLKLQDDLLAGANREVALEATIEQLGKDAAAIAAENERLKGELADCEGAMQLLRDGIQAYCDSEKAMRDELAEAQSIVYDLVLYAQKAPGAAQTCHRARAFLAAPPPAEATSVQPCCLRCGKPTSEHGLGADCRIFIDPAPSDDIRERQRIAHHSPKVFRATLDDHEERLAALEAKGEPGTAPGEVCSACRQMAIDHVNETCDARQFVPMEGAKP